MKLEKFIIQKINQTTNWGWIMSLDEDVIDIMVPDSEGFEEAEKGVRFMVEIFTKEARLPSKPIKYLIWNTHQKLFGVSDPDQPTELISLEEAIQSGESVSKNDLTGDSSNGNMFASVLNDGQIVVTGTVVNPKRDTLIYLSSGYLMEIVDYPDRQDVVGFFQPQCVAIPMTPVNNLVVVGEKAVVLTLDTKHIFSLMHKFEEARFFYRHFKNEAFARAKKCQDDLNTKTPAERYLILLEEHPWVLEHVESADIASYLKISVEQYQKVLLVE